MRHLADVAALRGDPPAQRQLLIDGMNDMLGTDCGFFYVGDGWRADASAGFTQQTLTTRHDAVALAYMSTFGVQHPLDADPFCYHSIRDANSQGLWTLASVLPDRAACRQFREITDLIGVARWRDGVVTHFRTGPERDRIVGMSLHRLGNGRRLKPRELAVARFALDELRRLVDRGYVSLPGRTARELPPRLRQILDRLLAGRTPKSIARELRLSVWTVREHLQRLYRHFNVSGREELTARFMSEGDGGSDRSIPRS